METKTKSDKQAIVAGVGIIAILLIMASTVFKSEKDSKKNNTPKDEYSLEGLDFYPITGPELSDRLKLSNVHIIDIRTVAEFGLEHIPDSKNIPADSLSEKTEIDTSKDIVLIGTSDENQVKKAISILSKKTSKKIFILQGGFVDWKAMGETTVTWGDPSSFSDQAKTSFITIDEFKKLAESNRNITLIDARKSVYFNESHIKGAINIPLSEVEKRRDDFIPTREIIVYSDDELEAFQEAVKIFDLKFLPVKVLKGGFEQWKAQGNPVSK